MTIEQYLKSQLGELQFALAATMAERDSLKAKVDELSTKPEPAEAKKK